MSTAGIVSDYYHVAPSAYLKFICRRMAMRYWWMILLPAPLWVAAVLTHDVRWAIVAFMMLLVVYPMLMSLTVLGYATHPVPVRRSFASRAYIDGDYIRLAGVKPDSDVAFDIETMYICDAALVRGNIIIRTGPHIYDFIIVPADAFSAESLALILKTFVAESGEFE